MTLSEDDITLKEAKEWLRPRLKKGAPCPCCKQFAKIYRRKLNSSMAVLLIRLSKISCGTDEWIHISEWLHGKRGKIVITSQDYPFMRHWKLIEEKNHKITKELDKKNSGYWRITPLGESFVRNIVKIKSHLLLYDGRLLGIEGEEVSIKDCLGKKFSYSELMGFEL